MTHNDTSKHDTEQAQAMSTQELKAAVENGFKTALTGVFYDYDFDTMEAGRAAFETLMRRLEAMEAALKQISDNAPQNPPSMRLYVRTVDYAQDYGAYQQAEIARNALEANGNPATDAGG